MPDVEITELEEFEPSRVDGVGKGANGFPILMMKGLPQVPADMNVDAAKADGSCPTCHGSGKIRDGHVTCPDCDGTGKAPADAEKAELDAKARNKLDDSDFAFVDDAGEGHLPINDAAHVRAALGRFGQTEFDKPAQKKQAAEKILAAAKKFDIDVSDDTDVVDAAKAVAGDNPLFASPVAPAQPDASVPGSPTWEASDADTAAQAAAALMQAADLIRTFASREGAEVAAGEGSDLIDEFDALMALDAVTCALGTMARLAFLEGAAATKAEDGEAAKAGKVLSSKSVDAIRAAIKALNDLLASAAGGGQPAAGEDGDATKETLKVEITPEALADMVAKAATDAVTVAKSDADAAAKTAAKEAKKAAKAEQRASETPEETAARKQAKADKREAKKAAKAEQEAAKADQTATAVVEKMDGALKAVTEQVDALKADLDSVKKLAAPGGPVKTRTQDAINKSEKRDALELEIADLERRANLTTDSELRKGYLDRAKEARGRLNTAA